MGVIVNGDLEEEPAPTGETSAPLAPKTAKQLVAKRNQERVKSILLLAIPDEYLLKFHNVYEDEMKRSSIPLLLLRTCHFFPLRTLQYNERALSLHNQQPVLNLKMRIFSIFDEETWKEIGILDAGIPGKRSYGDNGWSNAPTKEYSSQALVAQYGLRGYDRVMIFEVEPVQHSFNGNLFFPSSSSSSDNEVRIIIRKSLENQSKMAAPDTRIKRIQKEAKESKPKPEKSNPQSTPVNLGQQKILRNVEVHVGKLKLFEEFHVVDMEREPTCPLLVGKGFLATANAVIDCKKVKIAVGEGLTRSIFEDGIGAQPPYYAKRDFWNNHLPGEWGIARDAEVNPFKDILVFRKMVEFIGAIPINLKGNMWESKDLIENPINWNRPPKEGDGVWHIRIELIDPDGEKFDRAFQSILANRRLSLKENPSDILNLDHFHDS
ncbi:MAK10-like protein [Tanacetum coccineum]|uniref:MAK10-like protein n=1 Tax=Tanacetum coccineum TaxID=301880 RepID=A0ABQ5HHW6_9ASTR